MAGTAAFSKDLAVPDGFSALTDPDSGKM